MAELSYNGIGELARTLCDNAVSEIIEGVTSSVTADGKITIPFEQFIDLSKAKIKLNTATKILSNVKDYEKADYVDELLLKKEES